MSAVRDDGRLERVQTNGTFLIRAGVQHHQNLLNQLTAELLRICVRGTRLRLGCDLSASKPLIIIIIIIIIIIRTQPQRDGDPFDGQFLFQRISVLIQRFNAILFHETFPVEDGIDT